MTIKSDLFLGYRKRVFVLAIALAALGQPAYANIPLAYIEGELTDEMRVLLAAVIGEAETPPRSLAQARRRAEKAAEQAKSVMRSQGYYGAEIKARIDEFTPEGDEAVRRPPKPVLRIISGPQFVFSDVGVSYPGPAPDAADDVAKIAAIDRGSPAIAARVVAAELRAVNYLTSHGYPETQAMPRNAVVDHDTKTMAVDFNLSIGDKTRFGVIEQAGSAYILKSWPKMISPFEPGEVFSDQKLNKLTARVISTGAFESATSVLAEKKTPNADGTVTRNVKLNVEQGSINTVTGEVGYSTTGGSGFDASYERRNFIGYAQTLTVFSTLKTNEIRLAADYHIPFVFRADRSLNLDAEIAREDTDAFKGLRAGSNVLVTQKLTSRWKVGVGAGLEASRYEQNGENVTAYLVDGIARTTYDSRDSLLDPVKGFLVEASAVPSYNFGEEDGFFSTAQASAATYRRVSDSFVIAGRVKAGTIFGASQPTIPLNRRFYGGGGGSVRGFSYQSISPVDADGESIGGRSLTEASLEMRYHGEGEFGGVVFVDAGSVTADDLPTLQDVRYGAGVGLRYYTSFAPLRADIAFPLNKRDGDNSFQIYISIGQAF